MGHWTLRTQLVVIQVALLATVSLIIGLVSVFFLNRLMVDRLTRQLMDTNNRGVLQYDQRYPASQPPAGSSSGHGEESEPPPLPPASGPGTLSARVPAGATVALGQISTPEGPSYRQQLTAAQNRMVAAVPVDNQVHDVDLGGSLGSYLIVARVTGPGDRLITGLPLQDVQDTVLGLTLIVTGVTMAGLMAVALAGTMTVRLALRPLRRVAATARRVAQLPLDRGEVALAVRVPEVDTDDHTEVGQVGHALNRMLEHVASALQIRQDSETRVRRFVADASHELRTPLAAIRGYAELTRRARAQASADVAHALERVESEARRMTDLVEELLLLARLDEGRPLDREPVDLSQLVVDVVSDAHAAGAEHHWHLQLPDEPVTVTGDRHRLHQVLANLLANARTHTPAGTRVTVTLTARDGAAEVQVADDGPGILPDLLPEVFERFARADTSRSRAAGSTGLGLAIVQAVVRAHGGRVGVRSRPGETVFTVRLPLGPAADRQPPGGPDRSAEPATTR